MRRRDFIKWNTIAASAAALPAAVRYFDLLLKPTVKAKSVVVLTMDGGPSQVDLFDYKPRLHSLVGKNIKDVMGPMEEIKHHLKFMPSPYSFKKYGHSEQWVSELFPYISKLVDDLTFIKTYQSSSINHVQALLEYNTGVNFPGEPFAGAWLNYALMNPVGPLPGSFVLRDSKGEPKIARNAWSTKKLPTGNGQLILPGVLESLKLFPKWSTGDIERNSHFIKQFEILANSAQDDENQILALNRLKDFKLINSMRDKMHSILKLENLTKEEKQLYALENPVCKDYGEQLVVARRLVEAGVPYVQVYVGAETFANDETNNWDHHKEIRDIEMMALKIDQPTYGFIKDLQNRGLLDQTIVTWGGEFGKLPLIDIVPNGGNGRPHNRYASTMWMAGAGIKKGFSLGETDDFGILSVKDPVMIGDVWATIFHLMGIDHQKVVHTDGTKAPIRLTRETSRVLREILS